MHIAKNHLFPVDTLKILFLIISPFLTGWVYSYITCSALQFSNRSLTIVYELDINLHQTVNPLYCETRELSMLGAKVFNNFKESPG